MDGNNQEAKMSGVRVYKTGQRIIIEIDGAEDNFDQAILQFLSAFLNQPMKSETLNLQPVTQESSKPMAREDYSKDLILTEGGYIKEFQLAKLYIDMGKKHLLTYFIMRKQHMTRLAKKRFV